MSDTMPDRVYRWCQGCVDRDAEIATLRERLAKAEAERTQWIDSATNATVKALESHLAASRALADRMGEALGAMMRAQTQWADDEERDRAWALARPVYAEWEEARRG